MSGSGSSWAYANLHLDQTPAPHHLSFFTGWMPFLPPHQQHQSTEGIKILKSVVFDGVIWEMRWAFLDDSTYWLKKCFFPLYYFLCLCKICILQYLFFVIFHVVISDWQNVGKTWRCTFVSLLWQACLFQWWEELCWQEMAQKLLCLQYDITFCKIIL